MANVKNVYTGAILPINVNVTLPALNDVNGNGVVDIKDLLQLEQDPISP